MKIIHTLNNKKEPHYIPAVLQTALTAAPAQMSTMLKTKKRESKTNQLRLEMDSRFIKK